MDIIIVDDDKFMAKIFDRVLAKTGLEYSVYQKPHDGLEAIISQKPACVILDYMMPDIKGDELIVRSSQECLFKHCNFIMITGEKFDEMQKMKLMTLGFQYIFSKKEIHSEHFIETVIDLVQDKKQAA